jgi:hypothetical protein
MTARVKKGRKAKRADYRRMGGTKSLVRRWMRADRKAYRAGLGILGGPRAGRKHKKR